MLNVLLVLIVHYFDIFSSIAFGKQRRKRSKVVLEITSSEETEAGRETFVRKTERRSREEWKMTLMSDLENSLKT